MATTEAASATTSTDDATALTTTETPGTSGYPVVGETPSFLYDLPTFFETRLKQYGRVFRTNLLGTNTTFVCSYTGALSVLRSSEDTLHAHSAYAEFLSALYPRSNLLLARSATPCRRHGLFILDAVCHPRHFPIFSPRLFAAIEREFLPARSRLSRRIPTSFRPYAFFKRICQHAFLTIVFGPLDEPTLAHLHALRTTHFNGIVALPLSTPGLARRRALHAHNALMDLIQERLTICLNSAPTETSILSLCATLHRTDGIPRHAIVNTVLLLLSPAISKSLATVCAQVVQSHRPSHAGLHETMQEVLRLFPPIPACMRAAPSTPAWRVWTSVYHANRDGRAYGQPGDFRPARWRRQPASPSPSHGCPFDAPSDLDKRPDDTPMHLAFGAGDRDCKGRHLAWFVMHTVLHAFFQDFRVPPTVRPLCAESDLRFVPVVRPVVDKEVDLFLRDLCPNDGECNLTSRPII